MSNIIVADAGQLHYLILIDCADVLTGLFDHVFIPQAVRNELLRENLAEKIKTWMPPKRWHKAQLAKAASPIYGMYPDATEALHLAFRTRAAGVLMDDLDGRKAARSLGLTVIGTVGLLERAAEKGLLELPTAIAKLRETNFFISPELLDAALERDRLRREKS